MAEITAQLVKQLREMTGAGMMECKKALVEANGDFNEAQVILRKRGLATAAKKASRTAKEGLIGLHISPEVNLGLLVEVNCETDFVAKTDDFKSLVEEVKQIILTHKPVDAEALKGLPSVSSPALNVESLLKEKIAKVGENMNVPRFVLHPAAGALGSYTHPGSKLVVLVDVTAKNPATLERPEFKELIQDVAMQVAAADPKFLTRDDVTAEYIAKEKEIQRARALAEGKPEKIVDKVVEGRMSKFYEEVCLLDQPFIKENSVTISQLLADKGKQLGDEIGVASYVRFKVGETAAAEEPAAE
ncbi:translation elongation factor Ts [Paludibaculum fermentans]|uniref:Elongation factor Ts n=1 Tax=Paludibaculum fermentans TaxID=1473598 RepID=A0A7S7NXJ2_PALFE|nr:translation elongation factor Ts [Paludibaculum fermentans]QOY91609.1 translation elongation factor Ts [Paludibaculum fermentans]